MTNAVQRDKTTLRENTNLPPRPSRGTVGPWATEAEAEAVGPSPPDDFRFPRGDVSELADDDGSAVIEAYLGEKIEVRPLLSRSHVMAGVSPSLSALRYRLATDKRWKREGCRDGWLL